MVLRSMRSVAGAWDRNTGANLAQAPTELIEVESLRPSDKHIYQPSCDGTGPDAGSIGNGVVEVTTVTAIRGGKCPALTICAED